MSSNTSAWSRFAPSGKLNALVLGLNTLFWILFWIDIGFRLAPYDGMRPEFHGNLLPEYVWYGRGVPSPEDSDAPSLSLMRAVQQPVYTVVKYATLQIMNRMYPPTYIYRGETFGGVSYAGYQVIGTMVLSFIQWYGVAKVVSIITHRRLMRM
jgi:hypothetical protein